MLKKSGFDSIIPEPASKFTSGEKKQKDIKNQHISSDDTFQKSENKPVNQNTQYNSSDIETCSIGDLVSGEKGSSSDSAIDLKTDNTKEKSGKKLEYFDTSQQPTGSVVTTGRRKNTRNASKTKIKKQTQKKPDTTSASKGRKRIHEKSEGQRRAKNTGRNKIIEQTRQADESKIESEKLQTIENNRLVDVEEIKCDFCNTKVDNSLDMKIHMEKVHGYFVPEYECRDCYTGFDTSNAFF